jgi:hypothetical protein
LVVLAVIVVTLAYFALADWLYMARLAGICLHRGNAGGVISAGSCRPQPVPSPAPPVQTTIDRDEPILSDLPNLAVET